MAVKNEFRLPLDELMIKSNVSAGINVFTIFSLAEKFRNTTEDVEPIVVSKIKEVVQYAVPVDFRLYGSPLRARSDGKLHAPFGTAEMYLERHTFDKGWRIMDGRHRFLASVIAGRKDILCVEEK